MIDSDNLDIHLKPPESTSTEKLKLKYHRKDVGLPTRLRELVQNIRDVDMEIKKSGHYINSYLINRYTRRLLQIADELEKREHYGLDTL